jgi:XTP/dITP diphosphohydrolase
LIDRPTIDRLVVASKNEDKIGEIEAVLVEQGFVGEIIRGLTWSDIEESGATLEENALLKARAVMTATGLPALADDTGLEVASLGGAPGVQTARFAGPTATYKENVVKLLATMAGVSDRRATFRTVMALVWPSGKELMAEGQLDGTIAPDPRGEFGFGYDPIFEVGPKTLGELEIEKKNEFSHRAQAIRALATKLRALES